MSKRTYKPEEIVAKLRQVDVLHSQGSTIADAIRQIGVSEVTFYRWRKEYRRIPALLRQAGWQVNDRRIERLWRREGLKAPYKQRKRGRLLVQRRLLHPSQTGVSGSRLVVRLRP